MRVSEAVPSGRFAELYNPEKFEKHKTIIVFTRNDINQKFNFI